MQQLQNIEAIEKRLWKSADTLRANSELASNEYFMPVMGLIFLRHAYSRYLTVRAEIEKALPSRGGKTRALTKEDFSGKTAIFLAESAQFDNLVALSDADNRAEALISAMESISKDYTQLKGQLPTTEYQDIPNEVLGQLLRLLNPDELKQADGDIFGRIYEYFLTQFADQGAHDGGEFFTPISLVQLIVNVIEPDHGKVFDPACGSGGMFVQSAHFVERQQKNPGEALTFYGHEKNKTTTRLAKMNLRVHGLEGNIAGGNEAITYYNDPHQGLRGDCDFVMANPPFNVDEVDADKIRTDQRLPFGLPSVNQAGKVSNGNYLWISYFYSYLNDQGRAGFVMSSQASSAGGGEAAVRQALVETGHVDVMIDIRSNFFYTRSVPCQLWFLNRNKPEAFRDKVLMLDARHVFRKVTRKIYDFSPEQLQNLTSIVWLYRGETERFVELVWHYVNRTIYSAHECKLLESELGDCAPMPDFLAIIDKLYRTMEPFLRRFGEGHEVNELREEFWLAYSSLRDEWGVFEVYKSNTNKYWNKDSYDTAKDLLDFVETDGHVSGLDERSHDMIKTVDMVFKVATRLIELCEKEHDARDSDDWDNKTISNGRNSLKKQAEAARSVAVDQLKQVRYFYRQAHWLLSRFPDGELVDVEGLVKLVNAQEIEANDWSLTPGRYVGVAPEEVDEDFDFEEALRDIHIELQGLNDEAAVLAGKIAQNFRELGV